MTEFATQLAPFAGAFWGKFLQALTVPAALIEAGGEIVAANDGFAGCFGVRLNEGGAFGATDVSDINGLLGSADAARLRAFMADRKKADPFECSIVLASGQYHTKISEIEGPDGVPAYLCQLVKVQGIEETRSKFLVDHLNQGVWNYDVKARRITGSHAWQQMLRGDIEGDFNNGGDQWLDNIHLDDRSALGRLLPEIIAGTRPSFETQFRRKDNGGQWRWILCRARVMERDAAGLPLQIVGLDTDITDARKDAADLESLTNKMQLAIKAAGIGIWEFDADTKTLMWCRGMRKMYGLDPEQAVLGPDVWESHLHPDDRDATVAYTDRCLADRQDYNRVYRIVRDSGEVRHIRSLARYIHVEGAKGKLVGVHIDITEDRIRTQELERARKQLEHDSRHDALTGLGNRRLLDEVTQGFMSWCRADQTWAILHFDLDHFKQINDTRGHGGGDAVLVHFSHLLRTLVGNSGPVCRIGGDEFVVLLERNATQEQVHDLCKTIQDRVAEPLILQGEACRFGVSIGCALGQGTRVDPAVVSINADIALYEAKTEGRSCYRIFEDGMGQTSRWDGNARQRLSDALSLGQILCQYQPLFDPLTRDMIGAEALVRWDDPDRGLISPGAFLPLAQTSGMIARIDERVLDLVLADQTRWWKAGLAFPKMSLNMSIERLLEDVFLDQLEQNLKPYHSISFELLETTFWDNMESRAAERLARLRDMGVGIDLDDFGSGHSSIVALQVIRPDRVKLDRRLVSPLDQNADQVLTLQALMNLARLEGCDIVIEGVETPAQLEAVMTLGCEAIQGFVLSEPEDVAKFERRLKARGPK